MSITSDLRAYAEKAAGTAQAQLTDLTGNAQSVAEKAGDAINDLFASAEKAINLDAIKSAIEPYLAQAKEYGSAVGDRAEALLAEVKKSDPRVAKLIDAAESTAGTVVSTVQQRVVKPLTSRGRAAAKPAKPARKAAPRPATAKKPATTKPASRPAAKSTTRKAPAKKATQA